MAKFPILTLKSGRDKSIRNRHPWIYSGAVKERPHAPTGATVAVHDNKGELLGYGHYAPSATLICRIFAFGNQELNIDKTFWWKKLESAKALRTQLIQAKAPNGNNHRPETPNTPLQPDPHHPTNGYRLVHAEGDGLPGIVIDIYGNAASVQLRTKGAIALQEIIIEFLKEVCQSSHIFVQQSIGKGKTEGKWVTGGIEWVPFRENGMQFQVDIKGGQKTGFFLDQRDNRALVKEFAQGRTVLNAFSYSGAFSVFALAGNARQVDSVDISAHAIEQAEKNIALNFGENDQNPDKENTTPALTKEKRHQGIKADCFQFLKEMPTNHYDLIILDPPAFTKHISTVKKAARGYKEINLKALQKIAAGGLLFTYSCSQHISKDLFRKIVFGAAADAGRNVRVLREMGQAPDHPVSIYHPEGDYLKGLLLHVDE